MRFISLLKHNFFTITALALTISPNIFAALISKDLLPRLGKNIFTRIADAANACAVKCDLMQQEQNVSAANKILLEERYADQLKQLHEKNILKYGHRLPAQDQELYFYSPAIEHKLNVWDRVVHKGGSLRGTSFRVTPPIIAALMGGVAGACFIKFLPAIAIPALVSGYAGYRREISGSMQVDLYRTLSAYRTLVIQALEVLNNRPLTIDFNAKEGTCTYYEHYDLLENYHKEIGRVFSSYNNICDEYGEPVLEDLREVHKRVHETLQTMLMDPRMKMHPRLVDKWKYADDRLYLPIDSRSARFPIAACCIHGPYQGDHEVYRKAIKNFEQKERQRIVEPAAPLLKTFTR